MTNDDEIELVEARTLGEFIRARRQQLGLHVTAAAQRAGMSRANWTLIESGQASDMKLSTAGQIADVLQCPLETVIRLALGRELSRPTLQAEVISLLDGLPASDQLELLTTLEDLTLARRRRLGL